MSHVFWDSLYIPHLQAIVSYLFIKLSLVHIHTQELGTRKTTKGLSTDILESKFVKHLLTEALII